MKTSISKNISKLILLFFIIQVISLSGSKAAEVITAVSAITLHDEYQSRYMIGANIFAQNNKLSNIILSCDGDCKKQLRDIKHLVARTKGNIVFFVIPRNEEVTLKLAEYFEENGIYWVSIWNKPANMKVWNYKFWVAHFSYDNIHAGRLTAEKLIKHMKEKGKLLIIQGEENNHTSLNRVKGLRNSLDQYPQIKVIATVTADWDRKTAYEKSQEYLQQHPDLKAIWAASDAMALGALDAIKEAGKTGIIQISGIDGEIEMLEAIKQGNALCTIYNNAVHQAGVGVALAYSAKIKKITPSSLPHKHRQFYAESIEVDINNVDSIIKTYIANIPNHNFYNYFSAYVKPLD